MTERASNPKPYERESVELEIVSERIGAVIDVLGFDESDIVIQSARAELIQKVEADGHFDRDNPEHRQLLGIYQEASEATMADHLDPARPLKEIGYQLAQARLWLELDDPRRFYDRLGNGNSEGAYAMLQDTPGLEAYLVELIAVIEDLESLNGSPQETDKIVR